MTNYLSLSTIVEAASECDITKLDAPPGPVIDETHGILGFEDFFDGNDDE